MNKDLMETYHQQAFQEKYEVVKSLITSKIKDGESVNSHVKRMQWYVECLLKLNVNFDVVLAIDIVLHSFPNCYDQFILSYHLNNQETKLAQLQNLLQTTKIGMKGKIVASTLAAAPVLAIGQGKWKKRKGPLKNNWKG